MVWILIGFLMIIFALVGAISIRIKHYSGSINMHSDNENSHPKSIDGYSDSIIGYSDNENRHSERVNVHSESIDGYSE